MRALIDLQRQAGNQSVSALLTGASPAAGLVVQRQDDPNVITVPDQEIVVTAPASLRSSIGSEYYYRMRAEDFASRNPGVPTPSYYFQYGDKYLHRFRDQVKWSLSKQGQGWVDRTLILLQQAMEDRRDQNPFAFGNLELDDDAFRDFAYGTHTYAYTAAGLCDLPITDMITIGTSPDLMDILTLGGVAQIGSVFAECNAEWFYPRGPAQ